MKKLNCVCFHHLMETQGLVAPEAMSMGKLVLFSEMGPGPETIEHLKTGLLCNPYKPDDIAEKIVYTFDNEKEMKKIAEQGRTFVNREFNINKISNKVIRLYSKLLV